MPYIKKPAFEQYRAKLIENAKPLLEKDIVPIQAAIVAHLDTIPELLVQKTRRLGHKLSLVEITGTWVGLDTNPKEATALLRRFWPGRIFAGVEEMYTVGEVDESILLSFAATYPGLEPGLGDRFLTGRFLLTF